MLSSNTHLFVCVHLFMPLETSSVRVVTLRFVSRMSQVPCSTVVCGEGQHRLRDLSEKRHRQLEERALAFPSGLGLYHLLLWSPRGRGRRQGLLCSRHPTLRAGAGRVLPPLCSHWRWERPAGLPGRRGPACCSRRARAWLRSVASGSPGAGVRWRGAGRDRKAVSRSDQGWRQVPARRSPAQPARSSRGSVVLPTRVQVRKQRSTAAAAAPRP